MIDIAVYSKEIEQGLNAILKQTDLSGRYEFSVIPDHRRLRKARRRGNHIVYPINAIMTAAPSANGTTGDGLELVVENFTLDFAVPVERERADAGENPQSVDSDGVPVFVELVKAIVNEYFSVNTSTSYTVGGKRYAMGFEYTMSRTGESRMEPMIGEFVPFTVYISVNLVQNGINSKDVTFEIDGEKVPYQMLVPNRASEKSIAVFSDKPTAAGTLMTSTTLAFDVSLPATTGTVTEQFNDFLTGGKANVAHFVRYKMGEGESRYYLMTFGDISAQVEGVKSIGLTMPLVEAAFVPALLNFAEYVQVIPMTFTDLNDMTISFRVFTNCIIAFGREDIAEYAASEGGYSHTFQEEEVFLNGDGTYTGYLIACPFDKSGPGFVRAYKTIKAGVYGYTKFNNLETDKYYAETFDFYLLDVESEKFEHMTVTEKTDGSGLVNTITYVGDGPELVVYENDGLLDRDYIYIWLKEDAAVSFDFYYNFFIKNFNKST